MKASSNNDPWAGFDFAAARAENEARNARLRAEAAAEAARYPSMAGEVSFW